MELLPNLTVQRSASNSLTDQLVLQIRSAILIGRLLAGDGLPASRRLAASLGVSRSVVVAAYEHLIGEGFLESVQGSGTRVSADLPAWLGRVPDSDCPTENSASVAARHTDYIDLRPGRPYVARTPHHDWVRALSRAARMPWQSDSPPPQGELPLRRLLAAHTRISRGIPCSAVDVILTSGTSEALVLIGLALRQLSTSGVITVAIEDPGYPEGAASLVATGARIHPVSVGENGMRCRDLQELNARIRLDAVMLTPSHQFPLGGRLPASERLAILDWAHAHAVIVIEDDYDSEFRHAGAVLPAVASMDPYGNTVFIASLNKVLSPTLRTGMIVLPQSSSTLRTALLGARNAMGSSVPGFAQTALIEFLEGGGFKRAVARIGREYRHRRNVVLRVFHENGIDVQGIDGGLHVVVPLTGELSEGTIVANLREIGVHVEGVAELTTGTESSGALVIGYGAESIPRLVTGIEQVCKTIRKATHEIGL